LWLINSPKKVTNSAFRTSEEHKESTGHISSYRQCFPVQRTFLVELEVGELESLLIDLQAGNGGSCSFGIGLNSTQRNRTRVTARRMQTEEQVEKTVPRQTLWLWQGETGRPDAMSEKTKSVANASEQCRVLYSPQRCLVISPGCSEETYQTRLSADVRATSYALRQSLAFSHHACLASCQSDQL
jgi:hypothetical protein